MSKLDSPVATNTESKDAPPQKRRLYLAGGLFNAGERFHNLLLEKHLVRLGYDVILPQREATKFLHDGKLDLQAIVQDCARYCRDREVLVVASIDGADADSGTAVEYGMAMTATKRAVVYRTDFRTSQEEGNEAGVNGMLRAPGSSLAYFPCYSTDLSDMDSFYDGLARRLHEHIVAVLQAAPPDGRPADEPGRANPPAPRPETSKVPSGKASGSDKATGERLEKLVIGFLVSLVLKTTLDTAYGKVQHPNGLIGLLGVAYTLTVLSFLGTIVRFVFGVFRIGEEMIRTGEQTPRTVSHGVTLFNFACSVILFLGFYLGGLLITDTTGFYHSLIAVHIVDALWFFVARRTFFNRPFKEGETSLRKIFLQFVLLDVGTVVALVVLFPFPFSPQFSTVQDFVSKIGPEMTGLLVMMLVCIIDFWRHGAFFLSGLEAFRKRQRAAPAAT